MFLNIAKLFTYENIDQMNLFSAICNTDRSDADLLLAAARDGMPADAPSTIRNSLNDLVIQWCVAYKAGLSLVKVRLASRRFSLTLPLADQRAHGRCAVDAIRQSYSCDTVFGEWSSFESADACTRCAGR